MTRAAAPAPRPPSLARRAWWALLIAAAAGALLTGGIGWAAARALLIASVDQGLAERMAHHLRRPPGPPPWQANRPPRQPPRIGSLHIRILPPPSQSAPAPEDWPAGLPADIADGAVVPVAADGAAYRMLRQPRPDGSVVLLAADVTEAYRQLAALAWLLAGVGAVAVLLAAGLAIGLRRALLAPVHRLGQAMAAADPAEPQPFQRPPALPAELALLADRLDDFQRRLADVRLRERRVVAGLAHELRTPLAGLRAQLEAAAARGEVAPGLMAACVGELAILQGRTAALLQLARLDAGLDRPRRTPVALAELVAAAWAPLAAAAARRGCRLDLAPAAGDIDLHGDPDLLATMMANILGNAVAHGGAGEIAIAAVDDDGRVCIRICNPLAAVPAAPSDHAGLGLALVEAIAHAHEAVIDHGIDGRRYEMRLRWPVPAYDTQGGDGSGHMPSTPRPSRP